MAVAPRSGVGRRGVKLGGMGAIALVTGLLAGSAPVFAGSLGEELGRNEIRVYSAPFVLEAGSTLEATGLPERLERLGYQRVRSRPERPGQYFWGFERFWVYRRAHDWGGRRHPDHLFALQLEREGGRILGLHGADPRELSDREWIEPELLADSFEPRRARLVPVSFESLPEHVWRAVLAIEDARFFRHGGVDARSVARALLRNARAGKVTQGGSTITQQLVKMRDLSPRRTLGRKVSEAARALALEAEYGKEEILVAYLDSVYFSHLDGVSIYGLGTAARAYFSKDYTRLDLGEAALLAGMIQGPNRLHPQRNPEQALARQRRVLDRLEELEWAPPGDLARARRSGLPPLRLSPPLPAGGPGLLERLSEEARARAPRRMKRGRGVVVETTLDPLLQHSAERAVREGLARLRSRRSSLRRRPLGAALVAMDATTGEVLAYVGSDPAAADSFDRVRRARRQPGSTVKPFVALEALDRCGERRAVRPTQRISNQPLTVELPSGPWSPRNPDARFSAPVPLDRALAESLNIPIVRLARWCGFEAVAERFRRAGLDAGDQPMPAFVLGAVETSPLELAAAYTVFANPGFRVEPRLVGRLERPSGRRLYRSRVRRRKVSRPRSAWEVRQILDRAMRQGASRAARLDRAGAFGKTGTSSDRRDAWFAGGAGSVVAAVWVGLDDGAPLGSSGGEAAAPIWKAFMETALGGREAAAGRPAGGWRLRAGWGVIE